MISHDRVLLLTRQLLNLVFILVKLMSSRGKFYSRHHDLVYRYGISVSQMTTDMFRSPLSLSGYFGEAVVGGVVLFMLSNEVSSRFQSSMIST